MSGYLSGKVNPPEKVKEKIALALGKPHNFFQVEEVNLEIAADTIGILFRVGFPHPLKTVRGLIVVTAEHTEHTTGSITTRSFQAAFRFHDFTINRAIGDFALALGKPHNFFQVEEVNLEIAADGGYRLAVSFWIRELSSSIKVNLVKDFKIFRLNVSS